MEPIDDAMIGEDSDAPVLESVNEPDDMQDTYNFYEKVNEDIGRVKYGDPNLNDPDDDHITKSMMDGLQRCDVSPADSANDCAQVIKDKTSGISQDGDLYKPTFFGLRAWQSFASIAWAPKESQCRLTLSI